MDKKILIETGMVILPILAGTIASKLKTNSLIKKYIPEGVDFANELTTENRNKLIRAVSYIENKVLEKLPAAIRPFADFLINPNYIARLIERLITKKKIAN